MYGGSQLGQSAYGGGSSGGSINIVLLQSLLDTFDTTLNTALWNDFSGGAFTVSGGQLHGLIPDNEVVYYGILSQDFYTFTGSYMHTELLDAGDQTVESWTVEPVVIQDANDYSVYISISGNIVSAVKNTASNSQEVVGNVAYDSSTTRWFKIRELGGTISYQYSTDGVTWVTFATTDTTGLDTDTVKGGIIVGTWQAETTVTTAVFDNVNYDADATLISGTFLLGGGLTRTPRTITSSASGTFLLGGIADGVIKPILQAAREKVYEYKIFDPQTGEPLGRWDDVVSELSFSQEINRLGSAIDVTLARNSDSLVRQYDVLADDTADPLITDDDITLAAETQTTNAIGPGTTVDLNLDVKIYVFTEDLPDIKGELIFTGYISKYTSNYGQKENTVVSLFSYGADMDNYVLEGDAGETRVNYLSQDPSNILKDALDRFNADGGIPSYDQGGTTIDLTGTVVSYDFNVNTIYEVVNKCLELAPTDWYYWYDMALNNVHFHQRPGSPAHTFVLGEHILGLNLEKYIEGLTNVVYFTGGPQDPYSRDYFTDVAGTDLASHSGTVGAVWTKHSASAPGHSVVVTNADRIRGNSNVEGVYYASGLSESSDMSVKADFYVASWATEDFGLVGRVQTSAFTFYLARLLPQTNTAEILKCVAGSYTSLGTGTYGNPGVGTTHTMEFRIEGAELSLIIDGDTYVRATDTAIPTGNRSGVRMVTTQTNTTGLHFNNYFASSQANAAINIFKKYTNPTSIAAYRRGLQRITDNRVTLEESADILAETALARGAEPVYRSSVTISDKVYDIESIKLGQLITFANFGNFVDGLELQVVKIAYTPRQVTLQLDTLLPSVPKRLEDVKRNLNQSDYANNPDIPQT
jgi:hypothetical protein